MPEPTELYGWTLISLRPQNQHAAARRAAAQWRAKLLACSAFKLVPAESSQDIVHALAASIRIASSPAAVTFAQATHSLDGHWLAIGQKTADCLLQAGASSVLTPEQATAESLLNLPILQNIAGKSIGLLTAPNGRGLLEQALTSRGAILQIAHVYSRQAVCLNSRQLRQIDTLHTNSAFLVTSQQAFQQLWGQLTAVQQRKIKSMVCVASSQRLVEYLHALGMRRVLCSNSTLPQQQIRTLAEAIKTR